MAPSGRGAMARAGTVSVRVSTMAMMRHTGFFMGSPPVIFVQSYALTRGLYYSDKVDRNYGIFILTVNETHFD
jgi:hypothetical protein